MKHDKDMTKGTKMVNNTITYVRLANAKQATPPNFRPAKTF